MTGEHDQILTETIARHFPEATVEGNVVRLGFGELSIACYVNRLVEIGEYRSASLFFHLQGGNLAAPVFASTSGYDTNPEGAIVAGGCHWACSFGPVLRAGLAGQPQKEVDAFDAVLDGQRFRVFVDGIDRAVLFGEGDTPAVRTRAARMRLGGLPWFTKRILESGWLPLLSPARPTILSVFVSDSAQKRLVEVKVNGCDWPDPEVVLAGYEPEPPGATTMMRELAVLVPTGVAAPLSRAAVLRTAEPLGVELGGELRRTVNWRGFRRHGGRLHEPLAPAQAASVEAAIGTLPADYRSFLTEVGTGGLGPGYGLLPPIGELQGRLARGSFAWTDGSSPEGAPGGVVALSHAGCGVMWLLVLRGPHQGEVWLDSRSSDRTVRRVAGSFSAWYRDWLESAVADAVPWSAWDADRCATPSVLSQAMEHLSATQRLPEAAPLAGQIRAGQLTLAGGDSPYFEMGAPLDPCHACILLAGRLGLDEEVFAAGQRLDESPPASGEPDGFMTRWGRRLRFWRR